MYAPLSISATLKSPLIVNDYMPLDAILGSLSINSPEQRKKSIEWQRFKRNADKYGIEDAKNFYRSIGKEIPSQAHFMPLAVFGHGVEHAVWVYCASAVIFEKVANDTIYFNKRHDILQLSDWLEDGHKRIETGKGEFKNEHIPFFATIAEKLMWYVCGERAEIENLLDAAYEIGKKRRRGMGNISAWTIEDIEKDKSIIDDDGNIMRPVPMKLLSALGISGKWRSAYTAYKPPYHEGRFVERCAVPY